MPQPSEASCRHARLTFSNMTIAFDIEDFDIEDFVRSTLANTSRNSEITPALSTAEVFFSQSALNRDGSNDAFFAPSQFSQSLSS